MRFLPYLHPLWQVGTLLLAVWALRIGLEMRGSRRGSTRRSRPRAGLVARHVRVGLSFAGALVAGYASGPVLLGAVRAEPVFRSGHAFFGSLTLALALIGAGLGLRLRRGAGGGASRDLHAYCMGLAVFLGLVAGALGLGLLP